MRAVIALLKGMAEDNNKKQDSDKAGAAPGFPSLDNSPLWKDDPPAAPSKHTEAEAPPLDIVRAHFPRIAKTIEMTWGSRELEGYLTGLVISDREGRQGFPPVVLEALLKISRRHAQEFSFKDATAPGADPYAHNAFRKR